MRFGLFDVLLRVQELVFYDLQFQLLSGVQLKRDAVLDRIAEEFPGFVL